MQICNDVMGYKNRKIYQDDRYFKFSLDGVLLSHFVTIKLTTKKIIDIGTGTGIIPLILSLKTNLKIDAVEIQKELYELFNKTIKLNHLQNNINLINIDIKEFSKERKNLNQYDIVVSNPPYFNKIKNNSVRNNARCENCLTIKELVSASNKILKDGGSLYLVYDVSRYIDVIKILIDYNFSIKKIRYVHYNTLKEASIFLIEAVKNGKTTTKIMPPFILFEKNGIMTKTYENIYQGKE